VPDDPAQLTSDHGWDVGVNQTLLSSVLARLKQAGIRSSLFLDPNPELVAGVKTVGADRIELYTEGYAQHYDLESEHRLFESYEATAEQAQQLGIGVNAGHDLDIKNLRRFLEIPNILEVSIGHALVVESILYGLEPIINQYLAICAGEEGLFHYF
jgi:pyridoxine 5-phosphate synthase